eukprot:603462-Pyramimonas_sp.AAC.1
MLRSHIESARLQSCTLQRRSLISSRPRPATASSKVARRAWRREHIISRQRRAQGPHPRGAPEAQSVAPEGVPLQTSRRHGDQPRKRRRPVASRARARG